MKPFSLAGVCLLVVAWTASGEPRPPRDREDLVAWLGHMRAHGYQMHEIQAATGMPFPDIAVALRDVSPLTAVEGLRVLPYPGGRHPRIGFLDGAIDPQRETKISVFTPWDATSYVVVDVPEALWSNLGLTYLAHTHIDTIWSGRGVNLAQQEWEILPEGHLKMERALPNGIRFGTLILPKRDHVAMVMWLHNGTADLLSDLRVQNCVMLKGARGFEAQTNANKTLQAPFVAVESARGGQWIVTAWEPCQRAWANPPVPCLHADPQFPDTAPGQTTVLNGWLSFHKGPEIASVFAEIRERWKPLSLNDIQQWIRSE